MSIFVTGGLGFVGTNVVDHLIESGFHVIVFDNFYRRGVLKNLQYLMDKHSQNDNFEFVKGDVRDFTLLDFIVSRKDVKFIIHLSAQTTMINSITNPREDFEINVMGTFNVCETARKNNCGILNISSNKVYGDGANTIKLKELEKRYVFDDPKFKNGIPESFSTDWDEHSPYGCSKYSGDLYVRDYGKVYGLPTGTFRCSAMYGLFQRATVGQGWIAWFLRRAIMKKPVTIFGDGKQVRDCLFGTDVAKLFEKVVRDPKKLNNEAFNVGGGIENSLSILELIEILKSEGYKLNYDFGNWRQADQKVYISDISKVCKRFNWKPEVTPEEGVRRLIRWTEKNKLNLE